MIVLRLLSLLVGGMVLLAPPMVFADAGRAGVPGLVALAGSAGLALVAVSFFFIAFAGNRMRKSAGLRVAGGVLLAIPVIAGAVMLWNGQQAELLCASGVLLALSIVLFVSFVFPATSQSKHRPMRKRDAIEPTLRPLARG
jgi:hypothetical protein